MCCTRRSLARPGTRLPVSESSKAFLTLLSSPLEVDNDGCYIIPDLAYSIPSSLSRRMYRCVLFLVCVRCVCVLMCAC